MTDTKQEDATEEMHITSYPHLSVCNVTLISAQNTCTADSTGSHHNKPDKTKYMTV